MVASDSYHPPPTGCLPPELLVDCGAAATALLALASHYACFYLHSTQVRPIVHGAALAGAGGGGFMFLITKEAHARGAVEAALAGEQCVVHDVAVDCVGLRTKVIPA